MLTDLHCTALALFAYALERGGREKIIKLYFSCSYLKP